MKPICENIIELIQLRSTGSPDKNAFVFLDNGEDPNPLTFSELEKKSFRLAAHLQAQEGFRPGERALLLHQPGLEYIVAFFGCICAGAVPVPVYPPSTRNMHRLRHIISDSDPRFVLAEPGLLEYFRTKRHEKGLEGWEQELFLRRTWIGELPEEEAGNTFSPVFNSGRETAAFLQYTSGSTSLPKGVLVSHYNLLHNAALGTTLSRLRPECVMVSWLPPYHDMGLIGGIFKPLYLGMTAVLMAPISFIKKPLRWLRAISETQTEAGGFLCSGGPNFGYDYCVQKIKDAEIEDLDLSNWKIAFSGAEAVKASTLKAFSERFKPANFDFNAYYPVYGLAEATLLVSAGTPFVGPVIRRFDDELLQKRRYEQCESHHPRAREMVGCGHIPPHQELVFIDPDTKEELAAGHIGEICIAGDSVAMGYFKTDLNDDVFKVALDGYPGKQFLRTGDLGFANDGALFIQGRVKDLIIIRGKNYYPHDIESALAVLGNEVRPNKTAAFPVLTGEEEQLVLVQELKRITLSPDALEEVAARIMTIISKEFGLKPHDIVLVGPSSIPQTSSGKIQRRKTRDKYENNELKTVFSWKQKQKHL